MIYKNVEFLAPGPAGLFIPKTNKLPFLTALQRGRQKVYMQEKTASIVIKG